MKRQKESGCWRKQLVSCASEVTFKSLGNCYCYQIGPKEIPESEMQNGIHSNCRTGFSVCSPVTKQNFLDVSVRSKEMVSQQKFKCEILEFRGRRRATVWACEYLCVLTAEICGICQPIILVLIWGLIRITHTQKDDVFSQKETCFKGEKEVVYSHVEKDICISK